MNERPSLKLIVYLIAGAALILGTLGRLIYNDFFGTSDLLVWAPYGSDAQVSIDGEKAITVSAGTSRVLEASRGSHEITSTVHGETFTTRVKLGSGGARYAVPVSARQCFVIADVTRMYTYSSYAKSDPPRVEARHSEHEVVKLPKGTFIDAPLSTKRKGYIYVVRAFDCEELKVSDTELLLMMGFS